MKKFTFALFASAVGILSMPANVMNAATDLPTLNTDLVPSLNVSNHADASEVSQHINPANLVMPYLPTRANEDPITVQPEGECVTYVRESTSYWSLFGNVFISPDRGSIAKVVKGEDNKVYYFNPFGMQAVNSWLEGTIDDGGVMTFELPQPVMKNAWYEYFANAVVIADGAFDLAEEQVYQLKYDGDNIVAVDPDMVLALTTWANSDHTALGWTGYGDKEPLCVVQTETPLTLPANLAAEPWGMIAGAKIGSVNVAIEDNKYFWMQGLSGEMPEAWAKAEINGENGVIHAPQYMGPNYKTGHFEYLHGCAIDSVLNPEFEIWDEKYIIEDQAEFHYDKLKSMLKALPLNNLAFATTADASPSGEYQVATLLRTPVIKKQDRVISTPPMAPSIVEYAPFNEEYGYGSLTFTFPPYDADYNTIDTDCLYYEFWVNGKPFVFYPDEYDWLDEEMELVPYSFTDYYWFETSGLNRTLYFFFDGASSMGIRTIFKNDEVTVPSEYVAVIGSPSVGVEKIEDGSSVVSREYYNLQGMKLNRHTKGITVVKTTLEDGAVIFTKQFTKE